MVEKRTLERYIPVLIFLIMFTLYLKTVSPTISPGDSGEFVVAAYTLGLPHPPSFPLYILAGRWFSLLPLGEIAFRVNLMGPMCGGIICVLLFLSFRFLLNSLLLSLFGCLFFGLTSSLWMQVNRSEVYALYLIVLSFIFYLFYQRKIKRWDYLITFFLALGFAIHPGLALAHILIAVYLLVKKEIRLFPLLFNFLFVFFMYFTLPIRSLSIPLLNWGQPDKLSNFISVLLARGYKDMVEFNLSHIIHQFSGYFSVLTKELLYFGVLFTIWGAYCSRRHFEKINLLIISVILVNPIFLTSSQISAKEPDFYGYISPLLLALLFWVLIGLDDLINKLSVTKINLIICFTSLVFIGFGGYYNFQRNDQSNNYLAYDYPENILKTIPTKAALLNLKDDDSAIFGFIYLQVTGKSHEVEIDFPPINGNKYAFSRKPRYYGYSQYSGSSRTKFLNGLIFQDNPPSFNPIPYYRLRGRKGLKNNDYDSRELVINQYIPLASVALRQNKQKYARRMYEEIEKLGADMPVILEYLGTTYLKLKEWRKASELYDRVIMMDPVLKEKYYDLGFYKTYNDLGLTMSNKNQYAEAIGFFTKSLNLAPGFSEARFNLAMSWEMAGDMGNALKEWGKYLANVHNGSGENEKIGIAKQHIKKIKNNF